MHLYSFTALRTNIIHRTRHHKLANCLFLFFVVKCLLLKRCNQHEETKAWGFNEMNMRCVRWPLSKYPNASHKKKCLKTELLSNVYCFEKGLCFYDYNIRLIQLFHSPTMHHRFTISFDSAIFSLSFRI